MSPPRLAPVVLAAALAACAGDRQPTEPSSREPTDGPRTSLEPPKPAWEPSRKVPFQRVSGSAASAAASALPYSGVLCTSMGAGGYVYELRIPPASFLLMEADSIRVFWSLRETHYRPKGGTTSITVITESTLDQAALNPPHVHTSQDTPMEPDGRLRYFQPVTPGMLRRLGLTGGTMRVVIKATARAQVPSSLCGQQIAAVQAQLEIYNTPQLHIFN